jgi:prophage tail gpP-like protein
MADARLSVSIGGKEFPEWKSVEVTTSIAECAASFSMTYPLAAEAKRFVSPGMHVAIDILATDVKAPLRIAGDKPRTREVRSRIFTGWIEQAEKSTGGDGGVVKIQGRSLSGLFVSASADLPPGEWYDASLYEIATALAEAAHPNGYPFIFRDRKEFQAGPEFRFRKFSLQSGESIWSAIERGCRAAGVLAYSSPDGHLLLSVPALVLEGSAITVSLVEGENVASASLTQDFSERFGRYVVRGQRPGTDTSYGEEAAHVEGSSEDRGVAFFDDRGKQLPLVRRKVILAEGAVDQAIANQRAAWENAVRIARTNTIKLSVPHLLVDPEYAFSGPWLVNRLFWVVLPTLFVREIRLISSVKYSVDKNAGSKVELELSNVNAYLPQPVADPEDAQTPAGEEEGEEDLL